MHLLHYFPENALQDNFVAFLKDLSDLLCEVEGLEKSALVDMLFDLNREVGEEVSKFLEKYPESYWDTLVLLIDYEGECLGANTFELNENLFGGHFMDNNRSRCESQQPRLTDILFSNELKIKNVPAHFIVFALRKAFDPHRAWDNHEEDLTSIEREMDDAKLDDLISDYMLLYSLSHFQVISYDPPDGGNISDAIKRIASDDFVNASFEKKVEIVLFFEQDMGALGGDIFLGEHLCSFASNYLRCAILTNREFDSALEVAVDVLNIVARNATNTSSKETFVDHAIKMALLPFPDKFKQLYGSFADKSIISELLKSNTGNDHLDKMKMSLARHDYYYTASNDKSIGFKRMLSAHEIHDYDYLEVISPALNFTAFVSHPEEFSSDEFHAISKLPLGDNAHTAIMYLMEYLNRDKVDPGLSISMLKILIPYINWTGHVKRVNSQIEQHGLAAALAEEVLAQDNLLNDCELIEPLSSLHNEIAKHFNKIKNPKVKSMLLSSELGF